MRELEGQDELRRLRVRDITPRQEGRYVEGYIGQGRGVVNVLKGDVGLELHAAETISQLHFLVEEWQRHVEDTVVCDMPKVLSELFNRPCRRPCCTKA